MTLADWEANGWLHQHKTSRQEVLELLHDAESDLKDARRDLFEMWSFSLACTAALNLCTLLLHSSGYRVAENSHHRAVHALPIILGEDRKDDANYLACCLQLRQQSTTQTPPSVTAQQVSELTQFTENLYESVLSWLSYRDAALVANSDVTLSNGSDWLLSFIQE